MWLPGIKFLAEIAGWQPHIYSFLYWNCSFLGDYVPVSSLWLFLILLFPLTVISPRTKFVARNVNGLRLGLLRKSFLLDEGEIHEKTALLLLSTLLLIWTLTTMQWAWKCTARKWFHPDLLKINQPILNLQVNGEVTIKLSL